MKLTKIHREAFVRSVMADIPSKDYVEEIRTIIRKDAITHLPQALRDAIAKDATVEQYLRTYSQYVSDVGSFSTYCRNYDLSAEASQRIAKLADAHREQNENRIAVRRKLEATIAGCSTLRIAKERLPEFEKYLPVDSGAEKSAYLPATADLVTHLTILGWPKDKKVATQSVPA